MIRFSKPPKFLKTRKYFKKLERIDVRPLLEEMGNKGVRALAENTPKESGETASSWSFKVLKKGEDYKVVWTNSAIAGSIPIVLLLQYGHATKAGYFLPGRDVINPALRPAYKTFLKRLGQEVAS